MSHTLIIAKDYAHLSEIAAETVLANAERALQSAGRCTLGLATGSSPVGTYQALADAINAGRLDTSKICSFNLDEYVGLPGANAQARTLHPESYSFFMIQHLFGKLQNKFRKTHIPPGCLIEQRRLIEELQANPSDWTEQGSDAGRAIVIRPNPASAYLRWIRMEVLDSYEQHIRANRGIDLCLIGMGERGHVAFHEVGIPFANNRMLLVKLDDNTVGNAVADGHFTHPNACPRYAVSMGAELVFESRAVVLLASGPRKASAMLAALLHNTTEAVPVSYAHRYAAQGGQMLTIADRDAAELVLQHRAQIEQRGIVVDDRS